MAEKKEKRYLSDNAQLMSEWNCEKNLDIAPSLLTLGSNKKVWWKCNKEHEWQATINSRNRGNGCPYCSGRFATTGVNDLQTTNPALLKEWNYEKNGGLSPNKLTVNCHRKVWWSCKRGHEWQAAISHRNRGSGCPYCAGRIVLNGYNDLKTVNPRLATEWNYEKNDNLKPENVTANSGKKVWWKCNEGHEWQATIDSRNKNHGCPYCSGRVAIKGKTDLQTANSALAKEWNYERNGDLKPESFKTSSAKKVWWRCSKGHEWQATINHRNNGCGCPVCNSERKTSFPEYALVYYLKKYELDVMHSYKEKGYELDVYIPSKQIAIEYDGYLWHKNKTKNDLEKNLLCVKDGIKLFRIREGLLPLNDSSIDYIVQRNQSDLAKILKEVLSTITGAHVDIDLERDTLAIENLREHTEKENSFVFYNPHLVIEWHCKKNGNLEPEGFAANSDKKVWWKCNKGHEWQSSIASRNRGHGCPYCSGRYAVKGENDLQTINPYLAKEWNFERNKDLKPDSFTPNSSKKVWWKCKRGHEWQAAVYSRNNGTGCPYCSGNKVLEGYNDLQTVNPDLAKEWNFEKNGDLKPNGFTPNSDKKVWWRCKKEHEWQSTIGHRNNGRGCPHCAREKRIK